MKRSLFFLLSLLLLSSCHAFIKKEAHGKESPLQEAVTAVVCEQAAQQKLEILVCGMPEDTSDERFALHYLSSMKLKIEETRSLFLNCIETFLDQLNQSEKVHSLLKIHPVTVEHLNVNITFADSEGLFREPPFIAYVFLKNGKICYCYYDNLFGKFTEYNDVEEDYNEARTLVNQN